MRANASLTVNLGGRSISAVIGTLGLASGSFPVSHKSIVLSEIPVLILGESATHSLTYPQSLKRYMWFVANLRSYPLQYHLLKEDYQDEYHERIHFTYAFYFDLRAVNALVP